MVRDPNPGAVVDLWGVELSPFALKIAAMFEWADVRYRWLPRDGRRIENVAAAYAITRAKRRDRVQRYDGRSDLDELPQVPFLILPDRSVHYDSSAIAGWIDGSRPATRGALIPSDPLLNFVVRLIDEALDEFGLYMVHHNRWVLAAADNGAGERLGVEFSSLLPAVAAKLLARRFPQRQVRRLPYLFSVAAPDFRADLPRSLTPPSRPGFPGTHELHEALIALRAVVNKGVRSPVGFIPHCSPQVTENPCLTPGRTRTIRVNTPSAVPTGMNMQRAPAITMQKVWLRRCFSRPAAMIVNTASAQPSSVMNPPSATKNHPN